MHCLRSRHCGSRTDSQTRQPALPVCGGSHFSISHDTAQCCAYREYQTLDLQNMPAVIQRPLHLFSHFTRLHKRKLSTTTLVHQQKQRRCYYGICQSMLLRHLPVLRNVPQPCLLTEALRQRCSSSCSHARGRKQPVQSLNGMAQI